MCFWYYFLGILGFIILLIFIFGFPRKKNTIRAPNFEGLDDPQVAKAFERMSNLPPFELLRRKVISKLKTFTPQGTLVDLGCGSGNLIVQIAKKLPSLNLIGLDISSEILEFAKKRAMEKKIAEKIEFKLGNAEKMPFEDNSIDFLVSTLSLHHWENPSVILKEIYRVLKENGVFLIFDFRRDSRKFFYSFLTFVTKVVVPKPLKKVNEPLGSLRSSYTLAEVLQLCAQCPFQEVKVTSFLAWMFISGKK
ncbi:MAG: methyltransferase domain-containing protein [Candidatus Helarchaeota archaeon]|nr:methyltransferase domain-containing protein [Candidatus Helarchaeota archaeon]